MAAQPAFLSEPEFAQLAQANEPLDRFGPETDRPFIAIHVDRGAAELARFVKLLPCPALAIGGGSTALERACDVLVDTIGAARRLAERITAAPWAAMILVQHLRASELLAVPDALIAESLAFAAVQQGPDFQRWKRSARRSDPPQRSHTPLTITRDEGVLRLTMTDGANLNAIGIGMRDAITEGLDLALTDPSIGHIHLDAVGRCFSTGGDPDEFGTVADPATAHWIRTLRLPAHRAARLSDRLTVRIDGAAIGAGIELAAFGHSVVASPRSWFQLPELAYGLIPGAGGTVSIPRRIGRQRTAYLALSGKRISADQALKWGLIDAIES